MHHIYNEFLISSGVNNPNIYCKCDISLHLQINMLVNEEDATLSKTVTRMLQGLLGRELAMQYSLTGLGPARKRTKLQFNTTTA